MSVKDKVSIVTGAAKGIGEGIAQKLGEHGSKIIIADIDEEDGIKALDRLESMGIEAIFVKTDISNEQDVKDMIQAGVQEFGGIDILINNAAISLRKSVLDTTLEEWQKVLNINLTGAFLCSKYSIPEMEKRGGGSIVNIASFHADSTIPRIAAYATSKGGLTALTRQMALDCGPLHIRVNAVSPGIIDSGQLIWKDYPNPDEALNQSLAFQPLGRIGTIEDVANSCLFLASDQASYISGHTLRVDGGVFSKMARPLLFD
ncbi:SDR family NAD(P)-dependent oxidoreductase [Niallia endozanthoxylica]|uniref:Glucose 1-dehydrogenase n=1 Tax=Niallia endozanthoxylica TaxID=2036016 RepID=A0A5J5I3Q4_9BACI|nr:glucose 1-dehydrogenase [Niallia endozanthoxylica]KAA9029451.1 glucose 1-dehydrogenase [Niallia endozanthoxylica]